MLKNPINKAKIKFWLMRYVPAEIVCTVTAISAATITYSLTKNNFLTALAGTWGENVGFYCVMVGREIYAANNHYKKNEKKYTVNLFIRTIKNLVLEFGPAEMIDSFISRPFMMFVFPKITGNIYTGILAGKFAADIIIYIPIIISYELQQAHKK